MNKYISLKEIDKIIFPLQTAPHRNFVLTAGKKSLNALKMKENL
jgi:hypothetical protein